MAYVLYIIVILIIIDIYYRFKKQKNFNLLTKHLAFVINRYEKILLDKGVITEGDMINTRKAIREEVNEQDFLKLKKMVVAHDDIYLPILTDIIKHSKNSKNMLGQTENVIYMMDKQKLSILEKEIHKDNE